MFISKRKHEHELQKLRLDAAINDARLVSMVVRSQKEQRAAQEAVRADKVCCVDCVPDCAFFI